MAARAKPAAQPAPLPQRRPVVWVTRQTSAANASAGAARPANTYCPVGSGPFQRVSTGSPSSDAIPSSQRPSGGCSALSRKTRSTTLRSRKCHPCRRNVSTYVRPGRTSSGSSIVRPGPSSVNKTAVPAKNPMSRASRTVDKSGKRGPLGREAGKGLIASSCSRSGLIARMIPAKTPGYSLANPATIPRISN